MDSSVEQLLTPSFTPKTDDLCLFVDAVKSLLDESDIGVISTLADRLRPFRIDLRGDVVEDTCSVKPILVLDYEQSRCPELSVISQNQQAAALTETTNGSIIFQADSAPSGEAGTLTIPDEQLSKYLEITRCNDVSQAQGMDYYYDKQRGVSGGEGLAAAPGDPFLAAIHSLQSAGALQLDSTGMYFDDSGMSSYETTNTDSSSASMALPNMDMAPRENKEPSPGGDLGEYVGDYYVESPHSIHTDPPASYTEITFVKDLSGHGPSSASSASSASLDSDHGGLGPWQATEEMESRSSRNTSPAQSISQTAWHLGTTNPKANDGRTPVDCAAGVLSDGAMQKVFAAARACIRSDYLSLLETNLPRWATDGLWHKTVPPSYQKSGRCEYEKLQKAYSCLCRLDMRMKDDAIRSRMAMVLLHLEYENTYVKWKRGAPGGLKPTTDVGRGTISSMIDDILETTHSQWKNAGSREKSLLRANFHERKRFGKRWWILINALGPSILILCSSKFAAIM
ncbi:uncharacterized protein MAM_04517 [Metarhizium album ARSEF 1941]|uniref:Uncharacterized protein n=1 Tax=Metarhizium album (strain ARSEF 1941) TaxID=1081103 RepID=A0A0B2WVM4_METAS|nr:uncharacterized protein MAM_04517 [Metarhizium album ARSEF 1941]KHN97502.1 hypothetical protein MAM_04517 [Metarhizium album ARSEF 1941]